MPRISCASRLSMRPQLVEFETIGNPASRVRREPIDEPSHVGARRGEVAVRLQRESAAVLLRHDHAKAVVLENRHDHLADARLVVVGAAAVEIDDGGRLGAGG